MNLYRRLPSSPSKKVAVVKQLAKKVGMLSEETKVKKSHITDGDIQKVRNFYMSDQISLQLPGKKDCIIENNNGTKVYIQKKVMLMSMKEAHSLFIKDNSSIKIGKSKFAELRPSNVFPITGKDHVVCCCIYCENYKPLVSEIQKRINNFPEKNDVLSKLVCQIPTEECHLGNFLVCQNVEPVISMLFGQAEKSLQISYYEWTSAYKKVSVTKSLAEVQDIFARQSSAMRRHKYIAKSQLQQIQYLKANSEDSQTVVQIDFAENFCLKQQFEIMSAYWESTSITIFTAVMTSNTNTMCYAVVSNSL